MTIYIVLLLEGITTTIKHMEFCSKQKSVEKTFRSPTVIRYLFTFIVKKEMNGDSLGAVTPDALWNCPLRQIHTKISPILYRANVQPSGEFHTNWSRFD